MAEVGSRGGSVRLVQVVDPVPAVLGVSPLRTAAAEGHPAHPHSSDRTTAGALPVLLAYGAPAAALLAAAGDADLVVIGRGQGGAGAAPMLGGTARRVVGESTVPVVVVPPGWSPAEHIARPVVVQFDLEAVGGERGPAGGAAALGLAFQRARELDVPLVAIAAWRSLGLHGLSLHQVRTVLRARRGLVAAHLDPWRRHFSEVRLSTLVPIADPAALIQRLSYRAQLAVVGRQDQRGCGHPVWSDLDTASRGGLHAAACPVLVVPDHWRR